MFIVIEGLDGAGKSTQLAKIQQMLSEAGKEYEYLHFPRFGAPVYGDLIARFLRGELGGIESVNPYLAALIYAGDRQDAAPMIRGWLDRGKVVIVDRYVYSNIGYQCAKIEDATEKERLKKWILDLEYVHNDIPRPDLSLFLDVPFKFTRRKLTESRTGDDRDYLKGKQDIHEASLTLQERVRQVYLDCAAGDGSFRVIECGDHSGEMLPPDEIFKKISDEFIAFSK